MKTRLNKEKIKILIVDDHPIFRNGLSQLINSEDDLIVCGEAEDTFTAQKLIRELSPDIVIIDIILKDSNGIELIKDINIKYPEVFTLTLSLHDEMIYAERVLRAGCKGYVMKDKAPDMLITAIRNILKGNIHVSDDVSNKLFSKMIKGKSSLESSPLDLLTDRELEIFKMIGKGFNSRKIADKLHISIKTVENHRANIKEKLCYKNNIELIQGATLWIDRGA
ncbi:MAG: response regulator transcription factor [Spirochaetota bacterium]|nr:response regulator transcription factor [Spirochaetota bacterium]